MAVEQGNRTLPSDNNPDQAPEDLDYKQYPLSKKDQTLQEELQRKVDAYDKAENVQHPSAGPESHPPKVVITGPKDGHYENAKYDHSGTLYVTQAQAHDSKDIDFMLAHEVAHQKDKFDGNDERRADVEAARILGPQKTIDSIHHTHKINPAGDDPKLAAQDPYHHGTTIEREQHIKNTFPDKKLKMPKHRGLMQP